MTRLAAHPLAELFPLIEGNDFGALVEDIRQHGVIDRIELLDGQILDGRNRYNALVHLVESGEVLGEGWSHRAGEPLAAECLEPDNQWFRKFNRHVDGDPLPWVLSKNLKRRHLDESQRAMVAARIANMGVGRPKAEFEPAPAHIPPIGGISAKATAAMLNVGSRSVERARTVLKEGAPELQHAVEQGKVAVSTAETIASLPKEEQADVVARGEKEILAKAKEINADRRSQRRQEVRQLHEELSRNSSPLPEGRKYPVIYADPATEFKAGFGDRSIENHYPTESIEYWCTLPVGDLALDHCLLYCWTTVPQLAATIAKLLPAWGFTYKSCLCWDKTSPDHPREAATGYWARNQHELLLIATRGNPPLPEPANVPVSMYRERKGAHSEKPLHYLDVIEAMTPGLSRIELFSRNPRPGWDAWGNQAGGESKKSDGDPKKQAHSGIPAKDDADTAPAPADLHAAGVAPGPSDAIPGEGASGTAREAPSAGSGDVGPRSASGTKSAPPQSVDDMLEIPAFLRRRKDNSLPDLKAAS
ncbi:MAG: MT-A70 family methyltransferase [Xanthobacteraceae bacterium]